MPSVLDRDRTIAPPGYHRWLIPPARFHEPDDARPAAVRAGKVA